MNLVKGKHLAKGMKTIDMRTGEEKPSKGEMFLLGPRPGVCQQCAVDHPAAHPHNAQSIAYQYWFYNEHGRWPDWRDAMAHCSSEMQAYWRRELTQLGVDVDGGQVNLRKAKKP